MLLTRKISKRRLKQHGMLFDSIIFCSFCIVFFGLFLIGSTSSAIASPAAKITAGSGYTLGINSDGRVWAVGTGPLGEEEYSEHYLETTRDIPVRVVGLTGVTDVATGYNHAAALKNNGTVWCWGDNFVGQLGDGTITDNYTPVQVPDLLGVIAIAAGKDNSFAHTMALKNDGTVWGWGCNLYGQLGDGTTTDRQHTPVQVTGLSGITAITAGHYYTVALKNDGTVWAWGSNDFGQLGDGTTIDRITPTQVTGISGITAISSYYSHTVALKNDGTVWAWGVNGHGQLGNDTTTNQLTPVQVTGLSGVVEISAGGSHTVALKNDGTVWAWGRNDFGQLGDGTTTKKLTPVQVTGISLVAMVSAGSFHTAVIKYDGTVWNWGSNSGGQLGVDPSDDFPYLGPPYDDRPVPRLLEYTDDPLIALKIIFQGVDGEFSRIDLNPESEEYITMYVCDCRDDLCVFSPLYPYSTTGETINLTPSAITYNTEFISWTGCDSVDDDQCVVSMELDELKEITVTYDLITFMATATVNGGNGSITPNSATIKYGENGTFTMTAENGYTLATVTDNGSLRSATQGETTGTYTISLTDVQEDHTIVATFGSPFEVNASVTDENGSITPSYISSNYADSTTFTITPQDGYTIYSLHDNGDDKTNCAVWNGEAFIYTVSITAAHTIEVSFTIGDPNAAEPVPLSYTGLGIITVLLTCLGFYFLREEATH